MAVNQRNTPDSERVLAFLKVKQSIREDDLWSAAWYMSKFLKTPYVLSAGEREWLQKEYSQRMNRVRDAVTLLENTARQHAVEDFDDWLETGKEFKAVDIESAKKHKEKTAQLLEDINCYGRSAGYMRAIINMKVDLGRALAGEAFELEAMGASPGMKNLENMDVPEDDWEVIRPEEARRGNYHGHQWATD